MSNTNAPATTRVDKWLWAARFFKTRSLAAAAVAGHKVRIEDAPVKPARLLRVGETLTLDIAGERHVVVVRALSEQRGPASAARLLYEETAASRAERERLRELRRLAPEPDAQRKGRPSKRDRRLIQRFGA